MTEKNKVGRPKGQSYGPARELDAEEVTSLINSLKGQNAERNRTLVWLCLGAGVRIGEAASLTVADVRDPKGGIRKKIGLRSCITKSKRGRFVRLIPQAREQLDKYLALMGEVDGSHPLLPSRQGGHLNKNYVSQMVTDLMRKVGIDQASSHSFRRSYASQLLRATKDVNVIRIYLGHRHLNTTQKYLADCLPDEEDLHENIHMGAD